MLRFFPSCFNKTYHKHSHQHKADPNNDGKRDHVELVVQWERIIFCDYDPCISVKKN